MTIWVRGTMSAKHSPARKRAFLNYLAQTGNQTLSAERACVSCKWVLRTRASDPAFDAAYREAVEVANARFGMPGKNQRPCSSPHPAQPAAESPSPAEGGVA